MYLVNKRYTQEYLNADTPCWIGDDIGESRSQEPVRISPVCTLAPSTRIAHLLKNFLIDWEKFDFPNLQALCVMMINVVIIY